MGKESDVKILAKLVGLCLILHLVGISSAMSDCRVPLSILVKTGESAWVGRLYFEAKQVGK